MFRKLSALVAAVVLGAAAAQMDAQEAVRKPAATDAASAEQQGRVTRAREVIGLEVLNEAGDSYGMVDDLLLNKTSGQIEFLLVSAEKDSKEVYPLPWKSVTLYQGADPKDQYVIIGMERDHFAKAPTIVRQELPTMTYSQWNAYVPKVTAYYGPVRPVPARAVRRAVRRTVN